MPARLPSAVRFPDGILMLLTVWPVTNVLNLTDAARQYLVVMYCILAVNVIFATITYCMLCGVFVAGGDTRFGMFLDGITMWTLIAVGYLAFQMELPPLLIFLILNFSDSEAGRVHQDAYRSSPLS